MNVMKKLIAFFLTMSILIGLPLSIQTAASSVEEFQIVKAEEMSDAFTGISVTEKGRTVLIYFNHTPSADMVMRLTEKTLQFRVSAPGAGFNGTGTYVGGTNPIAITFGSATANTFDLLRQKGEDVSFSVIMYDVNDKDRDDYLDNATDVNGSALSGRNTDAYGGDAIEHAVTDLTFEMERAVLAPASMLTNPADYGKYLLVYFNSKPANLTDINSKIGFRIQALDENGDPMPSKTFVTASRGFEAAGMVETAAGVGKYYAGATQPLLVRYEASDISFTNWINAGAKQFKVRIYEKAVDDNKNTIAEFTNVDGLGLTANEQARVFVTAANTPVKATELFEVETAFTVDLVEKHDATALHVQFSDAVEGLSGYTHDQIKNDTVDINLRIVNAKDALQRRDSTNIDGTIASSENIGSHYQWKASAIAADDDKGSVKVTFPAGSIANAEKALAELEKNYPGEYFLKLCIEEASIVNGGPIERQGNGFLDGFTAKTTGQPLMGTKTDAVYVAVTKKVEPFTVVKVEEMPADQATDTMPAGQTVLVHFSGTPTAEALAITGFGKAVNIRIRATGEGLDLKDMNGEIVTSSGNTITVTFGNATTNNFPALRAAGYTDFVLAIRENGKGTGADVGYVKDFTDTNGMLLTAPIGDDKHQFDESVTAIALDPSSDSEPFTVTQVEEMPADQATDTMPAGQTVLVHFSGTPTADALAITGFGKAVNIRIRATGEGLETKDMNGEIVTSSGNTITVTFGNATTNNFPALRAAGYTDFVLAIRENGKGTGADVGYVKDFTDTNGMLLTAPIGDDKHQFDESVTAIALDPSSDREPFMVTQVEEMPTSQATDDMPAGQTVLVHFSSTPSAEALALVGISNPVQIRVRATGEGLEAKDMNGVIVASSGNTITVTFGNATTNNFPALRAAGYTDFVLAIRENGKGTSADTGYVKGFTDTNGILLTAPNGTVKFWDESVTAIDPLPLAALKAESMPKAQATADMPDGRTVLVYFNNKISDEALANTGLSKAVNIRVRATGKGVPMKEMNAEIVASSGQSPIAVVFGDDTTNRFDALTAAGYDTFTLVICENSTGTEADKGSISGFTDIYGCALTGAAGNDDIASEVVTIPIVFNLNLDSVVAISDIEAIITFSAPVEIVDDPFAAARLYTSAGKLVWKTPDGKYVDSSQTDGVKNTPMQWTLKYEWYNDEHTQLKCIITGGKEGMANFSDFNGYDWDSVVPGSYLVFGFEEKNDAAIGGTGYVDNIRLASDPSVRLYATKPGGGTNFDGAYVKLTLDYTPQTITASAKVLNDMQLRITFSQPVTITADPYIAIRFVEDGKLLWFGDDHNQLPAQFSGTWEWVEGSNTAIIWTMSGANSLGANNISDIINRRGAVNAVGEHKLTICIEEANGDGFTRYGSNGRVDNIASLDGKNHLSATVAASDGCYIDLNADVLKKDSTVDLISAVAIDDQTIELTFSEAVLLDETAEGLSMMLRYVNAKGNSEVLANGKTANFKGTWTYKDENKNVLIWKLKSNNAESLTDIFNYTGRLEWNKGARIVFIVSNTDDYVTYSSRIRGITDLSGYNALNARGTETPEVQLDVEIAYDLPSVEADTDSDVAVEYVTNYLPYLIAVGVCILICTVIVIAVAVRRKKEEKE